MNGVLSMADMERPHRCPVEGCLASFNRPYRLQSHIFLHDGKRPFQCTHSGCNKSYTKATHLKRHVDSTHVEASQLFSTVIKCTVEGCEKTFSNDWNLKKHCRRFHEESSKLFTCTNCSKIFKKHQQLKIHMFEHTGEKPFHCTHEGCDKAFLLPSKLKAHMKIHAGYACVIDGCGMNFPNWSALRKHKATAHPLHVCDTCNKSFTRREFLMEHLFTHSSEREVFHCPEDNCDRWYYNRRNLTQHIKSYHEKESFTCPREGCGQLIHSKRRLLEHVKRHDVVSLPTESRKTAKIRKDKGQAKKCMAAKLAGVELPAMAHKRLICDSSEENATLRGT